MKRMRKHHKSKSKIVSYAEARRIAERLRRAGKKVVFKTGCFDIFHVGHVYGLRLCKSFGDVLFVGVGSDKTLRRLKGAGRPLFPEQHRADLIAELESVDYVLVLDEPLVGRIDHGKILSIVRPHYYVIPADDKALEEKRKLARSIGAKLATTTLDVKFPRTRKTISTTNIIKKISN